MPREKVRFSTAIETLNLYQDDNADKVEEVTGLLLSSQNIEERTSVYEQHRNLVDIE